MMEAISFEHRFPDKIPAGGMWSMVWKLPVMLIGAVFFFLVGFPSGVIVILVIGLFYIPTAKISAIRISLGQCERAIEENKRISEALNESESFLITEAGNLNGPDERNKFLYALAIVALPIFFIIRSFDLEPMEGAINLIFCLTALGSGLDIFDVRNFQKYLLSIFEKNDQKILIKNDKGNSKQNLVLSLKDCRSQLDALVLFIAIVSLTLVLFILLHLVNIRMLILVPLALFLFVIFESKKLHGLALASFEILRSSDNYTKERLELIYKPVPEEPRKTFFQEVKSRLEESGYSGVIDQLNRDVKERDLFK